MARPPKKRKDYLKQKQNKPKHNWSNECRERQRMLDMKREKYFRLELRDVLEKTKNQDNKSIMAANIQNTAAKSGINAAHEYLDKLDAGTLEPEIVEEVKKLLGRYSKYR